MKVKKESRAILQELRRVGPGWDPFIGWFLRDSLSGLRKKLHPARQGAPSCSGMSNCPAPWMRLPRLLIGSMSNRSFGSEPFRVSDTDTVGTGQLATQAVFDLALSWDLVEADLLLQIEASCLWARHVRVETPFQYQPFGCTIPKFKPDPLPCYRPFNACKQLGDVYAVSFGSAVAYRLTCVLRSGCLTFSLKA